MGISSVQHDQQWLDVRFTDGLTSRFLGSWLRDNVGSGRHRSNGQRTFDINDLPATTIAEATGTEASVTVSFAPEGFDETFDEQWLRTHSEGATGMRSPVPPPTLWGSELQSNLRFEDYPTLLTDPTRLNNWLTEVRDLGFGLVENVPTAPGSILDVVDLFGFVRETNYGKLFDVRVEANPANLAFTNLKIGMHTDNPYRDPVPGLQLIHCLINESDGGANQLCDGFAVAERIRSQHPESFELLTENSVRFRFVDGGSADLQSYGPLIGLGTDGSVRNIRYNSRSVQAFEMEPATLARYYEAYRILGHFLQDKEAMVEFRLASGQMMIFDNQRILHGRSEYTEGARHLQGCYADKDSLHSRIRVLESQP